jgi:GAF domain-containing protein
VGLRLTITRGLAGFVASSGEALAVDDVRRDPRFASDVAERAGYMPTSLLVVPITGDSAVLGVLSVLDRENDRLDSADALDLAHAMARLAVPAMTLSSVFADLGRTLVEALAEVTEETDLHDALVTASAGSTPRAELAGLAALFAQLSALGERERRIAMRIVTEFADYARSRRRRW